MYNETAAPTLFSVDNTPEALKLYSFFCVANQQDLCLGISTAGEPSYNPNGIYRLQVKRRINNELKGLDYEKMRWRVDRVNGIIQMSNFTDLCLAKLTPDNSWPGDVGLRPCGMSGTLETWNLLSFLTNINEQGVIGLKDPAYQGQCLTVMQCKRAQGTTFCSSSFNQEYTGTTLSDKQLAGTYVKLMPCAGLAGQSFRQALDCAPGCSPFMLDLKNNVCDPACDNAACNWDNGACVTPMPTPPTPRPSTSPTHSPTTSSPTKSPSKSPSHSPSFSPTSSPTTSTPTNTPTTSIPTNSPTSSPSSSPSVHPTANPTTSIPTFSPSFSPTNMPTNSPTTRSPTKNPTNFPSNAPSQAPTTSPSHAPSSSPTVSSPTNSPTQTPSINVTFLTVAEHSQSFLWLWILLGVLGSCCFCFICFFGWRKKRERKEKEAQQKKKGLEFNDIEHNAARSVRPMFPPKTSVPNELPAPRMPPPIPVRRNPTSQAEEINNSDGSLNQEEVVNVEIPLSPIEKASDESYFREDGRRHSKRYSQEEIEAAFQAQSSTQPMEVLVENNEHSYEEHNHDQNASVTRDVNRMSIRELKSFILEQGGDLTGCEEKEQLQSRALELQ